MQKPRVSSAERDNELSEAELSEVSAGVTITKHVDKSSPSLFYDSGCPGFEYWFQQLMF